MTDRDEEIRALVEKLGKLLARARPIVEEYASRPAQMLPAGGQEGAETGEVSDAT